MSSGWTEQRDELASKWSLLGYIRQEGRLKPQPPTMKNERWIFKTLASVQNYLVLSSGSSDEFRERLVLTGVPCTGGSPTFFSQTALRGTEVPLHPHPPQVFISIHFWNGCHHCWFDGTAVLILTTELHIFVFLAFVGQWLPTGVPEGGHLIYLAINLSKLFSIFILSF